MKKLKDRSGETLIESLASILMIVMVLFFLWTAVETAARLNRSLRDVDDSFRYSRAVEGQSQRVTVQTGTGAFDIQVQCYEDNGYVFYDVENP